MDNPGVRFPPPLLFVTGLGLAALLQRRVPLPLFAEGRPVAALVIAYMLLAVGFAWIAWGIITFARARTGIMPHHAASRIVSSGPYRFNRNPMYTGMSGIYAGVTLWLNTWWAVLFFPLVIVVLLHYVIRREEAYLRSAFGTDYDSYCARVSRWGGFTA